MPFLWLSAIALMWGLGWEAGKKADFLKFILAGNGFFLGSIYCFRRLQEPVSLLICGALLNVMGGYFWWPALKSWNHGGWMLAGPGLVLLALWVRLIWVSVRDTDSW
ncbi:hypothetical protein EI77_00025 [Prosthecobacter fusiformis]|uniref:Uncharacterized protein n=1 Tax=Prosthecobacter fusiformis TaxID=48464 RepID=A0A4R7SRF5_9BACT|nr:hypothetical protein EI77_00025 [Prosthecobacter fusiformis]